jgi:catechol 2,3-dioxygenase-like lactoylglutathione lyase family enzyme
MIELSGLDHVVFRTTKLPEMLHFYCEVLGCTQERALSDEQGLTQLRAGDSLIDLVTVESELGKAGGKPPSQDGRNVDHVCLRVRPAPESDLIVWLDHHEVPHSGFQKRYGADGFGRSIYVNDPEGNVIELRTPADT